MIRTLAWPTLSFLSASLAFGAADAHASLKEGGLEGMRSELRLSASDLAAFQPADQNQAGAQGQQSVGVQAGPNTGVQYQQGQDANAQGQYQQGQGQGAQDGQQGGGQYPQGQNQNQPAYPNNNQGGSENPPEKKGRKKPGFAMGGNNISLQGPLQFATGSYIPRFKVGLQYQRQIRLPHWVYGGAGMLIDRGDFKRFGSDTCGIVSVVGSGMCQKGRVMGFEGWLGYNYKLYLKKNPILVPSFRVAVGMGKWKYPKVGKDKARTQARDKAWNWSVRAGAGIRYFLTEQIGIGLDFNLQFGVVYHTDRPILANNMVGQTKKVSKPFFGVDITPLTVEFRF